MLFFRDLRNSIIGYSNYGVDKTKVDGIERKPKTKKSKILFLDYY